MLNRQIEDHEIHSAANTSATLRAKQCEQLSAVIAELTPDWSAELHYCALGEPLIVILPDDLDDPAGTSIIVRRDDAMFHLEELYGDTYRKLGEHRRWPDVLRAVRARLIWDMPFPATLH